MINSRILNIIYDALKNIRKNSIMSIASVSVLSACLVIMGSSIMIAANLNQFVKKMESQNEIVLFLDEKLTEEEITAAGNEIKAIPNIESLLYVTKAEALEEYKREFGDQAELFAGLEAQNPLRNAYHIKVKNLKMYDSTLASLKAVKGVVKVREKQEIVDKLVRVRKNLSMLAIWILVILVAVSLFIISNTVRLAMFTRKLEINIMKFVGATDGFIRLPFLLEGLFIGLISSIVAFLLQWGVYSGIIAPLLVDLSLFNPIPFFKLSFSLFNSFLVFSLIIGVLGSIMPMRKYLKV